MNRSSFLKGLLTGMIGLSAIPAAASIVNNETNVKKLSDEQLNELYEAYISLKERQKQKEKLAKESYNKSIIEIEKQYDTLQSLNFIFTLFHKKKNPNINKLVVKKHIIKLQNYLKWLDKYFYDNPSKYYVGKYRNTRDMDYIVRCDVTIAIVKGYLLIGDVKKAESLFTQFSVDRNYGMRDSHIDDYALIYYGDMYFKSGYRKESLNWYNQSDKDRIVRWVKRLEENPNDKEVINDFNKRYYSSAYFGYMVYDKDNIYIKSCANYKDLIKKHNDIITGKYEFDLNYWI
jgi:hypothetical protein